MFTDEPEEDRMEAQRKRWKSLDALAAEMKEPAQTERPPSYSFVPLPNMARVSADQVERLSAEATSDAERAYIDAAWDRIWGRP